MSCCNCDFKPYDLAHMADTKVLNTAGKTALQSQADTATPDLHSQL